jgi:hypothetical protein
MEAIMADEPLKSRPKPPAGPRSVYGDQWGDSGKGAAGPGRPDRPTPISTPRESTGTPDPENSAPTDD